MQQFLRVHNLRRGTRVTVEDITSFMPHESLEYFENSGGYATLQPFEGVRTAIDNILKAGHEIIFVTARHSNFKGHTEMSFILNKIPLSKIVYAPRGKRQVLKQLKPDFFVDDAIKNLKDAEKAGLPLESIVLMDQPYNNTEEGQKYKRIHNLIQLERMICPEEKP